MKTVPRIDAHQHFWRYDAQEHSWITDEMSAIRKSFLLEDLSPLLAENHIDGTVAVQASQHIEETKFLLDLADKNAFIKAVVGWVDLQADDCGETLDYFSQNHLFKGVRHIVQAEPDTEFMLRENFLKGLNELEKRNLTYDILVYHHQLPMAIECVKKNPGLKFVVDHLAKPSIGAVPDEVWAKNIKALSEFPNVMCKVSGMVTEAETHPNFETHMEVVANAFGTERLMFGSDWPVCLVKEQYGKVVSMVEHFFSKGESERIMGGNAIRFYSITI